MSEMSEKIRAAIKDSGYSHRELEQITGIPHSAIQRYASGTTDNVPIGRLKKLAIALGKTPEYFMGWETKKPVAITDDGLSKEVEAIIEIFAQLTPDNRSKLFELSRLYLNDQRNNEGTQ